MNANRIVLALALGAVLVSVGCGEAEQSAVRTNECVDLHGGSADVSQEPNYDAEWVHRWSYEDGCHVRKDVIMTREGDGSCGDGQASEIVLGAKEDKRMRDIKIYQRDPENIYNDTQVSEAFDASVQLPDAAIDTGYQQGDRRLWLVLDAPEFIYVQLSEGVEKMATRSHPTRL